MEKSKEEDCLSEDESHVINNLSKNKKTKNIIEIEENIGVKNNIYNHFLGISEQYDSLNKQIEGYKETAYDSERSIIRYVDHNIDRMSQDKEDTKFILHMHSRLDMCPYCAKLLSIKLTEWDSKVKEISTSNSFSVMVSSRQEYSPSILYNRFIYIRVISSFLRGRTVRSLGTYLNRSFIETDLSSSSNLLASQIPAPTLFF